MHTHISSMETSLWAVPIHQKTPPLMAPCPRRNLFSRDPPPNHPKITSSSSFHMSPTSPMSMRKRTKLQATFEEKEIKEDEMVEVVEVTEHRDNWIDNLVINHLSQSLQSITGIRNEKKGYDSLIEASTMVARNYGTKEQEEIAMESIHKAIPRFILAMMRLTLRPSKFTRELFAFSTTVLFSWLVGPSKVEESEFEGNVEKNVVHIEKCRFLEGTNCVGMCTHMCKMPSQKFIKESLGIPVNMVPNFEDKSCKMIFGEDPPEPADDPAFKQPCSKILCKAKQSRNMSCSSK